MQTTPVQPNPLKVMKSYDFLRYISEYTREHGIPPAIRDIMEAPYIHVASTSTVNFHLKKLEAHGLLLRTPRISRGLRLTPKGREVLKLHNPKHMKI